MQFCLQEKHQKIFLKRVLIDENQPCVCAHKTQQKQIVFVLFTCKCTVNEVFKYFMVFEERANSVSSSIHLICNKKVPKNQ